MRRFYYLAMAVMLATMVGCQKDDELLNVQGNMTQTFYATFENGADTRTALDESNNVVWSEGDQISIFGGTTANNSFILKDGANTNYGTFKVNTAAAGTESSSSTSDLSANVAYYPYNNDVTVSENNSVYTVNATYPVTQTYSESGTFGQGASPMVAVTASTLDANLKFKNVGAIFRLQLKGDATITKVVFSADANLAGKVAITASNSATPTVDVTEGSNTVILNCGEGVALSETTPTNFVVALLPVEIATGGITITIYDNAGKKMVYTHKADEAITIERSKAYTTDEVTYSGNQDAVTAVGAQDALDAATSGTTIQLEPGVNYGTLYIRPVLNASHTQSSDWFTDNYSTELARTIEDVTIQGAPGAKVDAIEFVAGYKGSDYITGAPDLMCYATIKNLVIDGVEFTDNTTATTYNSPIYINLMNINVDGLTVKNCKLIGTNPKTNLVYIYGSQGNHTYSTASKNVTITGNSVDGIARLCELRGTENVTITNNIIKNTAEHGMLLADGGDDYSGNITITGNTADGINDRFVRMAGAGDANVTIKNNVITNHKGDDVDWIKVTDGTVTVTIEDNTFNVANAEVLQAAIKYGGNTVVLANDIAVDKWIMFSETLSIGSGQIITIEMNGLTIDGNGHTLTVNSIESAGNGNNLFHSATNLNISNLTIKKNCGGGAIGLKSGVISEVNFVGGGYGIHPGEGEIKVEKCTFATADGDAIYFEQERDNLTVTGCTFNQQEGENVILLRGDVKFTDNIVNSGRTVNIVSGSPVVTGNNFNNVRLKVYSAATATISNNTINNLAFEDNATTYSSTFADNTMSEAAQAALDAMTKN